jgi:hypothetical protein
MVLGYSRLLWIPFYPRQTLTVLMRGLEESFAAFDGVPSELLFDQMKAVIIDDQREVGGKLLENLEFVRSRRTGAFGSAPAVRIASGRRARLSGPSVMCVRGFFYGRKFLNDEDLNQQAISWTQSTANARVHRTTNEMHQVRFERDERATLQAPAPRPYRSVVPLPATPAPQPRLPSLPTVERRSPTIYSRRLRPPHTAPEINIGDARKV